MRSAGNFNSEWGYLAPAPSFMRTVRVVLVATAIGATAGAAVVLSLIDRPSVDHDGTASIAAHAIVTSLSGRAGYGGTGAACGNSHAHRARQHDSRRRCDCRSDGAGKNSGADCAAGDGNSHATTCHATGCAAVAARRDAIGGDRGSDISCDVQVSGTAAGAERPASARGRGQSASAGNPCRERCEWGSGAEAGFRVCLAF